MSIMSLREDFSIDTISLNDLSKSMEVKPSSAFEMLKKLEEKKIIIYDKISGINLTEEGFLASSKILFRKMFWNKMIFEKIFYFSKERNLELDNLMSIISTDIFDENIIKIIESSISAEKKDLNISNLFKIRSIGKISELTKGFKGKIFKINKKLEALASFCQKKGLNENSFINILEKSSIDESFELFINNSINLVSSKKLSENIILISIEYIEFLNFIENVKLDSTKNSSQYDNEKLQPIFCEKREALKLTSQSIGFLGEILELPNEESFLDFFERKNIKVGSIIEILEISEFDGFFEIKVEENITSISSMIAEKIIVKKQ